MAAKMMPVVIINELVIYGGNVEMDLL